MKVQVDAAHAQDDSVIPSAPLTRRRLLGALLALGLGAKGLAQTSANSSTPAGAGQVLIVADEFPAMQVLADRLKAEEGIESKIVAQKDLPADLAPFRAVIVYIHKGLDEGPEQAFIKYAEAGGRLILLHHSISSGKRKNKDWFKFLGVELPTSAFEQGGYKYYEGVTLQIADLAQEHFITANKTTWPEKLAWAPASQSEKQVPGLTLHESEVYLNHVLKGKRTILLGLRYTDAKTGKTYEQATAGWTKPVGKGQVIYLMPGHSEREFKDPTYGRMVCNAVVWKP